MLKLKIFQRRLGKSLDPIGWYSLFLISRQPCAGSANVSTPAACILYLWWTFKKYSRKDRVEVPQPSFSWDCTKMLQSKVKLPGMPQPCDVAGSCSSRNKIPLL